MQYYDFQSDLTKVYPILSQTKLILSDEVDANIVQDIIIQDLLPKAFTILATKLRLMVITVMIYNNIAYWDLIFQYPEGYDPSDLLDDIYVQVIDIDDSFDHNAYRGHGIHKISFKVFKVG